MSHSFIQNCCWITLQVSHHEGWRIVSKKEGKTDFSRRLKQLDGLTWLTLTPTLTFRQIYATGGGGGGDDFIRDAHVLRVPIVIALSSPSAVADEKSRTGLTVWCRLIQVVHNSIKAGRAVYVVFKRQQYCRVNMPHNTSGMWNDAVIYKSAWSRLTISSKTRIFYDYNWLWLLQTK